MARSRNSDLAQLSRVPSANGSYVATVSGDSIAWSVAPTGGGSGTGESIIYLANDDRYTQSVTYSTNQIIQRYTGDKYRYTNANDRFVSSSTIETFSSADFVQLTDVPEDTNTTYTFTDGTNGSFVVTPSNGVAQTVMTGGSGGGGAEEVSVEFDDTTRVLTVDVDGVSDTVTIPGGATSTGPFSSYTLTGTPSGTNNVPKWTGPNTLTWGPDLSGGGGGGGVLSIGAADPFQQGQRRYDFNGHLFTVVAVGSVLIEDAVVPAGTGPIELRGIGLDLTKSAVDLADFPRGLNIGA